MVLYIVYVYCSSEFVTLRSVEVTLTTPPSRPTQPWNGEGEALRGVPLPCTEGGEEEPLVGLIATEDGRPAKSDAIILALTLNEALVVDVTRGLVYLFGIR